MDGTSPLPLRLPRARRIQEGRHFLRARTSGKRLVQGCLIANWVVIPGESSQRIGTIASRKVGGAVQRNRSRRLLREVFRLHQHQLPCPLDLILIARPSIAQKTYVQVERDFVAAMKAARLWASEK